MSYVDSHCHLNLKKFSKVADMSSSGNYSIDAVVERANNAGVKYILNIGTELSDIEEMQAISASHENVFHTIGVHPLEAQKHHREYSLDEISRIIKANCSNEKCVGIGEIGLDYYYTKESAKEQKELFELQLMLAVQALSANVTLDPKMVSPPADGYARCTCNSETASSSENACAASTDVGIQVVAPRAFTRAYSASKSKIVLAHISEGNRGSSSTLAEGKQRSNVTLAEGKQGSNVTSALAVCIHSREAEEDTIAILKNHPGVTGVIHCFSGSKEFAFQALDLGFYISISGAVTFKNNTASQEIVKSIPLDRLLVETDAPFLAPVPFRGRVNEPAFVVHTARKIAELLGMAEEEVASKTSENFFKLYPRAKKYYY